MSVVFRGIEGGGDEVTEFAFVTDKIFGSVFPIPFVVCIIRWWFGRLLSLSMVDLKFCQSFFPLCVTSRLRSSEL